MKRDEMEKGDLVRVTFPYEEDCIGIFVAWDDADPHVYPRAYVFWDGEIFSTPAEQVEVISEGG